MTDQPPATGDHSSHVASLELVEQQLWSDRRQRSRSSQDGMERRQFGSNYSELTGVGAELGKAIDLYKVAHRRRYVTYDEILVVLETLGYERRIASADLAAEGCGAGVATAEGIVPQAQLGLPATVLQSTESPTLIAID